MHFELIYLIIAFENPSDFLAFRVFFYICVVWILGWLCQLAPFVSSISQLAGLTSRAHGPGPRGHYWQFLLLFFCKEDGCWKSMEEWESDETELEQHRGKFETSRGVREKWRIWERREEGELQRLKMKQKQRRPGSYQLSSLLFFFSFSILFSFFRESFSMFVPNFSSIDLPCLALPSFSFLLSLPFMGSRNASKFDRLS